MFTMGYYHSGQLTSSQLIMIVNLLVPGNFQFKKAVFTYILWLIPKAFVQMSSTFISVGMAYSLLIWAMKNWFVLTCFVLTCNIRILWPNEKFRMNSLWPCDAIWCYRSGLTLAQVMVYWHHQAITWTSVGSSSLRSNGNLLQVI